MNANIKSVHPETAEILYNAYFAWQNWEITCEQYNEVVLSCFKAEAEHEFLTRYPAQKARTECTDESL